ncbi:MAG: flagellin [Desulfobacteraceae bacterium]
MGLRIQNNIAAMNAHRQLTISNDAMTKSLERLSSGYRINRAADDAAGLSISQAFRADIASYKVASRNTSEANSMLQVAEGAMDQIGNMLTRLKELATQAASANVSDTNREKIEAEKAELLTEIDRIAESTEYAGSFLLNGTFGTVSEEWVTSGVEDGDVILDENTGRSYQYHEGDAAATLSFIFNDTPALTAQTYTMNTSAGATTITMVGADTGDSYQGTVDGTTLNFDGIGLKIVGESDITEAMADATELTVDDPGLNSMNVSGSTTTGTWAITDSGGEITLANGDEEQTVAVVDGEAQTLEFDQLGITLSLNDNYEDGDLDGLEFQVDGEGASTFQVGAKDTDDDRIEISMANATTSALGIDEDELDFSSAASAQSALETIDDAISTLNEGRGDIGAYQNRLSYAAANLSTVIENAQAAESVIRDVDMASEMSTFTKNQILMQAGTSMLAQANMSPQQVLSLFG